MEITLKELTYTYAKGTPFEQQALFPTSLTIPSGSYTAIIGHTGSGKSTLIQHLNGLLKPTSGELSIGEFRITSRSRVNWRELRRHVGLVFQYPEYQLFEETVEKDIAFGPSNYDFPQELIGSRVREAMDFVGLDYETFKDRSPFALSGGQMRRVALAGVLALSPNVLVLDEPTAGLDPHGKKEILERIYKLHRQENWTTILVTHSMEDAAKYADQIIVMKSGKPFLQGPPSEIFAEPQIIQEIGLDVPDITKFILELNKKLSKPIPTNIFKLELLEQELLRRWKGGKR